MSRCRMIAAATLGPLRPAGPSMVLELRGIREWNRQWTWPFGQAGRLFLPGGK